MQNDLFPISACNDDSRIGDVIFVHGLGGHHRKTWHPQGKEEDDNFWPFWLGSDLLNLGIWSLGYEVEPFKWKGSTMPLVDRAINSLALLDSYDIGTRPLLFISHSMGGLLVKQMLRHAHDFGEPRWKNIVQQTRGIVFLSTPHSGSDLANWVTYIGNFLLPSISVDELNTNHSRLRELNNVYRNHDLLSQIPIQVYCEKEKTNGILVVNETSADPGIRGVISVPMDCDHLSICRPNSRNDLIYRRVKRFIIDHLNNPMLFPSLLPKQNYFEPLPLDNPQKPNSECQKKIPNENFHLDHKYEGNLVVMSLQMPHSFAKEDRQAIRIILDISFGEAEERFNYTNKFSFVEKEVYIRFGIKFGRLRFKLINGYMPLNLRKVPNNQKLDGVVSSMGTDENPEWQFKVDNKSEAKDKAVVLFGSFTNQDLGIIKLLSTYCQIEACFQVSMKANDLVITKQDGLWNDKTNKIVKETKIRTFLKNVVEPKLKDYVSKVVLQYDSTTVS